MSELTRYLGEECGECGTPGPQRHLSAVGGCGTCARDDPRPVFTPLRLPLVPRAGKCYRADAGFMVHVKPDCRC